MKQVLITFGLLLLVILGFYWVSARYTPKKVVVQTVANKEIYFEAPNDLKIGEDREISLKAKYDEGIIVSYRINFTYDPAAIKIVNTEVNKDIFDKKAESTIHENFGNVELIGENLKNRSSLKSGEVVLATIKVKGIKKGASMIYATRKAEVGILEGNKVVEGNFQMPNFKVNFL